MGNTLQDQLFKAGLANKKQAVKARKAKNTKEKQLRTGQVGDNETDELVKKAIEEQLAKDRHLNSLKTEAANQKATQAQIKQLVALNRIEERGDIEFRFDHDGTIKTLLLSAEQRQALISGKLAIVKDSAAYQIVPWKVAEKIAERDESAVIVNNHSNMPSQNDKGDEYADFVIPDDLMW
ncbi:MAG: DUF2058 domain-containing protein [Granulosicoccaceae bacterium]